MQNTFAAISIMHDNESVMNYSESVIIYFVIFSMDGINCDDITINLQMKCTSSKSLRKTFGRFYFYFPLFVLFISTGRTFSHSTNYMSNMQRISINCFNEYSNDSYALCSTVVLFFSFI